MHRDVQPSEQNNMKFLFEWLVHQSGDAVLVDARLC